MILSICCSFLCGIYIVSLLFGNDLYDLRIIQNVFLIISIFITFCSNIKMANHLSNNYSLLFFAGMSLFILILISISFNLIDYKMFLFEIGNLSAILSIIIGIALMFIKDININKAQMLSTMQLGLLSIILVVAPIITYITCYSFRYLLGYSYFTILTTIELIGMSFFLLFIGKAILSKIKKA